MTRRTSDRLPPSLAAVLDGSHLETRAGETFLLVSVDEDGWPHVAMLSVGEVLATGPRELRLALWPGSQTTANLRRSRRALLMAVVPPATYHLRLTCRPAGEVTAQGRRLAAFVAEVEEVLEDVVAYAEVLTGISFRLVDPGRTVAAWTEAVEGLKEGR